MLVRAAALVLTVCCTIPSVSTAFERLPVPGGTNRLRQVMEIPASVADALLLAEAARAWYGTKDPITNPSPGLRRLLDYLQSGRDPYEPGPLLPLTSTVWSELLSARKSSSLALALVSNRNAMLLYRGLVGMDDATLQWMEEHPSLLKTIMKDGAAPFAFAAPAVRVRAGAIDVPGGAGARSMWEAVVGERVAQPEAFIARLMQRSGGRIAWLYSSIDQLDAAHARFALAGGEPALRALVRQAIATAPEWDVVERPFWRPGFDLTLVLADVDLRPDGSLAGSEGFWREAFRSDDLESWKTPPEHPLAADTLVELLFEQPFTAREKWEIFCLGQRTPGVEGRSAAAGLMMRGARRHPALAQMLDRIGVTDAEVALKLHRASARVTAEDSGDARGPLGAWQGMLAIIERASLSGGLDRSEAVKTLAELAALPLKDVREELTAWLMTAFLPRLEARPAAPPDADRLILQMISGRLTSSGPRRETRFTWEDLPYSIGTPRSLVARMEQAQSGQGSAALADARNAWRIAEGNTTDVDELVRRLRLARFPRGLDDVARRIESARKDRDQAALRREARRAAETICSAVLASLPYAPHLAVTEVPSLGADIAFRHEFVADDQGVESRRMRPWQIARGEAHGDTGWHLQGSLLLLDLALADWYLRRNGEPPTTAPVLDERDVTALAQTAAIARSGGSRTAEIDEVASAVPAGRRLAAGAGSVEELDRTLAEAGIDPWRRRALRLDSNGPADIAARLTPAEAWRLAGAPGELAPRPTIDGSARLGALPHSSVLMEGRRSAGTIGATAVDTQLRVAIFLHDRQLPHDLFGDITAAALTDVIETATAVRPDDCAAIAAAVALLDDRRMEEHLLALVRDGTLAKPSEQPD